MKKRVRLIHWKPQDARPRVETLQGAGYQVELDPFAPPILHSLRDDPPAAVVIDLGRMPAQGRDVAVWLRHHRTTQRIPLVFVGGDPEKVERTRSVIPDAEYTTWRRIRGSLKKAIEHPPSDPVRTESVFAAYKATPLVKKLGIKPNMAVMLIQAPEGFDGTLGETPAGVSLRRNARGKCDLMVWFVTTRADVERRIESLASRTGSGGLWVVWPKKKAGVATDLTQTLVRKIGLARGLVDYKVCAVDDAWTGLRFAVRRGKKTK